MNIIRVEHTNVKYKEWVRIEWNIGKRCNFDCSYCGGYLHDNTSPHLSLENVENTIKTIREFYKDKQIRISLTGGEPFVHPKILNILRLFSKYNIDEVSVITNGSLPLKKYKEAVENIDNIIFSWHFEFLKTDHMKTVLLGLQDHIKENNSNVHMNVHLMFLPGKLQETKTVIEWLSQNDIPHILRRIRPMISPITRKFNTPYSSGMEHSGPAAPDAVGYYRNEELEFLDSIEVAGTYLNCKLWTKDKQWDDNVNTLLKNKWNTFTNWKCMAGLETLMINNDGTVYRASCKQGGPLGNVETGFTLAEDPIDCKKDWCNCAADLNTTKWKPDK